jgi:hypothetical protein
MTQIVNIEVKYRINEESKIFTKTFVCKKNII